MYTPKSARDCQSSFLGEESLSQEINCNLFLHFFVKDHTNQSHSIHLLAMSTGNDLKKVCVF